MELKRFTDLIAALDKMAGGLKAIVSLPNAEREAVRLTRYETRRFVDPRASLSGKNVLSKNRICTHSCSGERHWRIRP